MPPVSEYGRGRASPSKTAFTLLEVVIALGVFTIGIVAVLGLYAPVTKSVTTNAEAEAAARLGDAVRARLGAMPFADATALIQLAADVRRRDADPTYNPNAGTRNPAVLFGTLNGEIGVFSASGTPGWVIAGNPPRRLTDAEKFFELDLIRNETLSPAGDDAAPYVAFTIRVRWPAFVAAASGAPVQVGASPGGTGAVPFDQGRKEVLLLSGSISR